MWRWARVWARAQARCWAAQVSTWGRQVLARLRLPAGNALGARDWRVQVGVECSYCGTVPAPACPHYYATAWAARGVPPARVLRAAGVERIWFTPDGKQLVTISLDSGVITLTGVTGEEPPETDYLEEGRASLAALTMQVAEMRVPY